MNKKGSNFFEANAEKIVIGIVALACVWLFVTRLILGSDHIKYEGKKFGPGQIDQYVYEKAKTLGNKLRQPPEPAPQREEKARDLAALLNSAISNIDASVYPPIPPYTTTELIEKRRYALPKINKLEDIKLEHIRAVAYVPVEELSEQKKYEAVQTEPNDLDLVTIEANFDLERLFDNFYECFAGSAVQQSWRDPCLAKPVFAAVKLERQQLLPDGSWSDWQSVPRSKTESHRVTLRIIEDIEKLPPGGLKVRLLQFDNPFIQRELLQPAAYSIASAQEEWFPPSLHKNYLQKTREKFAQEKREAREKAKEERDREREQAKTERISKRIEDKKSAVDTGLSATDRTYDTGTTTTTTTTRTTTKQKRLERLKEREQQKQTPETPTMPTQQQKSPMAEIYEEFENTLIKPDTDFAKLRKNLTIWSLDDTVEPGKTYRYQMRIGVFNPLAGTDQFEDQYKDMKDKVILWSEFSEPTSTVDIPKVLYFFATKVQEAAKYVEVAVFRYVLGYWYTKSFSVRPGEIIGKIAKYQFKETETDISAPEWIDYTTGALMVDVTSVRDWQQTKTLKPRNYMEMLYSFDGLSIEHMPISRMFWSDEVKAQFDDITKELKQPKQPWRPKGTSAIEGAGLPLQTETEKYIEQPQF